MQTTGSGWGDLFLIVMGAAFLVVLAGYVHRRWRVRDQLATLTRSGALRPAPELSSWLEQLPFSDLVIDGTREFTNILAGKWKGTDVVFGELVGSKGVEAGQFIVARVMKPLPVVFIRPKSLIQAASGRVGVRHFEFESGMFNERYRVTSSNEQAARAMIDGRMIAYLLDLPESAHLSFETRPAGLLVHDFGLLTSFLPTGRGDLRLMVDAAARFVAHIPRVT